MLPTRLHGPHNSSFDFLNASSALYTASVSNTKFPTCFFQLNSIGYDENLFEDKLQLYVIDNDGSPHTPIKALAIDEDYRQDVTDTKKSSGKTDHESPTTMKLITSQQQNSLRRAAATLVGKSNCKITVDKKGLLVRKAHLDGAVQILSLPFLRLHESVILHYPPAAGYPCQRAMYDTFQKTFCWPHTDDMSTMSFKSAQVVPNIMRDIATGAICSYY